MGSRDPFDAAARRGTKHQQLTVVPFGGVQRFVPTVARNHLQGNVIADDTVCLQFCERFPQLFRPRLEQRVFGV